ACSFFFQAEDGIRDDLVTGVQTCALPISSVTSGLAGKTLFVSGGSRGIGLAIALRAARDGANVAIAAKTDAPNPKLQGTIHTAEIGRASRRERQHTTEEQVP